MVHLNVLVIPHTFYPKCPLSWNRSLFAVLAALFYSLVGGVGDLLVDPIECPPVRTENKRLIVVA